MLAFALSVVSFPLLLDRNVGIAVAIVTSLKAIYRNPFTMALWGLFVAGAGFAQNIVQWKGFLCNRHKNLRRGPDLPSDQSHRYFNG